MVASRAIIIIMIIIIIRTITAERTRAFIVARGIITSGATPSACCRGPVLLKVRTFETYKVHYPQFRRKLCRQRSSDEHASHQREVVIDSESAPIGRSVG